MTYHIFLAGQFLSSVSCCYHIFKIPEDGWAHPHVEFPSSPDNSTLQCRLLLEFQENDIANAGNRKVRCPYCHCLLAHFGVWLYIFTLFRSQGLVTLVKHSHACCVRPMFCHRFEEEFSLQLRKLSGVHYSCTENSADKLPGWPSDTTMPRPVFSFDECVIPSVLT